MRYDTDRPSSSDEPFFYSEMNWIRCVTVCAAASPSPHLGSVSLFSHFSKQIWRSQLAAAAAACSRSVWSRAEKKARSPLRREKQTTPMARSVVVFVSNQISFATTTCGIIISYYSLPAASCNRIIRKSDHYLYLQNKTKGVRTFGRLFKNLKRLYIQSQSGNGFFLFPPMMPRRSFTSYKYDLLLGSTPPTRIYNYILSHSHCSINTLYIQRMNFKQDRFRSSPTCTFPITNYQSF